MKKITFFLIFFCFLSYLYSFTQDITLYLKVPNQYGDYSYLSQNKISEIGYKVQYIKLNISKLKEHFYILSPSYKLFSSDKFNTFYFYAKFNMQPYNFLVYSINLSQFNTDEFLFDIPELLNNASSSPIILLQRLFIDKNFYDDEGNLIQDPQNKIYLLLIDSSHFKRLLPNGNYIKNFFICVYYNKNNLTEEQMLRSLSIGGLPLPISEYKKYPLFEPSVMAKYYQSKIQTKQVEKNLYNNLTSELKKIRKKKNRVKTKEKTVTTTPKKKIIPIKKTTKTENIKKITPKTTIPKINKKPTKELITKPIENKKIEKHPKNINIPKPKKVKKIKHIEKQITKPTKINRKITVSNNFSLKYPIDNKIKLTIKGSHFPKPKNLFLSEISKYSYFNFMIANKTGLDTLQFIIPKGYSINGVFADSTLTITTDLYNVKKIDIAIKKLPYFQIIFIDKSEIAPIAWVGIKPIVKDIKKTLKHSQLYGIFYFENENLKGDFSGNITESYEDYIWDNIYPLATSSGIRFEHLNQLAKIWNKSEYSKRYIPVINLYLSRATLKSMIAMDDWEMSKKRFRTLKKKFGNCKFIIHSKIKKEDNIPLYKLGLPYKKLK